MVIAAMKLKDAYSLGGVMTNLDSILKSRDIILSTKVHLVKALDFPVVMYGCETWTIKKAECRRTDAFELWCWTRLLRVPWTARRSVLGVHWKDWCWSWNSSSLATWCKELTHLKRPWCWERLRAGQEGDDRGWDGWMASPTRLDMSLDKLRELVMGREAWRAMVHEVAKSWTRLSNWTELNWNILNPHQQTDYDSLKVQMMASIFLAVKYIAILKLMYVPCFLSVMVLHTA